MYGSTAKFADNAVATVRVERPERAGKFQVGTANVTLLFNVPRDGFDDAMLKVDNDVFPSGGSPVTIAIDSSSRFLWRSKGDSQLLISDPKGLVKGNVGVPQIRRGSCTFNKEESPTELWLDVTANPGMMIIFGGL